MTVPASQDRYGWIQQQAAEVLGRAGESGEAVGLVEVHRELGRQGLLAPHWPTRLGGHGAPFTASAGVVEQLVLAGYSDTLIVNSVYNVGHALLRSSPQHDGLVRRIAAGSSFAAVLFTEPAAGSDITSVACRAAPGPAGWTLRGEKTWIAQAGVSDHGVCLARTAGMAGDVTGLSLFLVPLTAPGVTVTELDTTWSEPLFSVTFDDVRLADGALLGVAGDAWELVSELLVMERSSPGYWVRGKRWWNEMTAGDVELPSSLHDELMLASALSEQAVAAVRDGRGDPVLTALAKYQGTVTSRAVAGAAVSAGWPAAGRWFDEAVGLVLAAGSGEMMLRQIVPATAELLDDMGPPGRRRGLHAELRVALADERRDANAFDRRGWYDLDVPAELGGEGSDTEAGAVLGHELGWAGDGTGRLDALFLADLLGTDGAAERRRVDEVDLAAAQGPRHWFDGAVELEPAGDLLSMRATYRYPPRPPGSDLPFVLPARSAGRRCLVVLAPNSCPALRTAPATPDGVLVEPCDVVPLPDPPAWDAAVRSAMVRHTAFLLGTAARSLREAARAGEERLQFGGPVLRNQDLAFRLAELCTKVTGARRLLWESCRVPRADTGRQYAQARRLALEAVTFASNLCGARTMVADHLVGRLRRVTIAAVSHPLTTLDVVDGWHVPRSAANQATDVASVEPDGGLHEAFRRQAVRTPEATALLTASGRYTYRDVATRADQLAALIAQRRLPAQSIIALALPSGIDLVAGMIAVMTCGHAFLPLTTSQPVRRSRALLDTAKPALVLTDGPGAALLSDGGQCLLRTDETSTAGPPAAGTPAPTHPEALAYVLFTSGSAGRPKGVMVSHRAITGRLRWDFRNEPLGPDDVVLSHTPAGFDPFLWEVFAPLTSGAAAYLASVAERSDVLRLAQIIEEHEISALTILPTNLKEALRLAPQALAAPSLRLIYGGGEKMPSRLATTLRTRTGAKVYNCYGLTETSIDATIGHAGPDDEDTADGVLLGRPVPGSRVTVRTADGEPVHPGVPGELCVSGSVLATGYLGDPRLTAERFRPDPAAPGERTFHTGDTVRRCRGGGLEFLGRGDDEIKLRGHRYHAAEVETALREFDEVAEAVVGLVGPEEDRRLVAAVVVTDTRSVAGLRLRLRQRLPAPMVPSRIAALTRLPLLPSGKVDRRAAIAAAEDLAGGADADTTDDNGWRPTLGASIVTTALGLPVTQSLEEDFFALGGDSLRAARVIVGLQRDLQVSVDVRSLLEATTVAGWLREVTAR